MDFIQPLLAFFLVIVAGDLGGSLGGGLPLAHGWPATLLGLVAYLAFVLATSRGAARAQLGQGRPFHMPGRLAILHLAAFAFLVAGTEWVSLVSTATQRLPFLSSLAAFSPFVAARLLRAWAAYEVERVAPGRLWSRREYLAFQLRVLALPVIPVLLLDGVVDLLVKVPGFEEIIASYPLVLLGTMVLLLPAVFAGSPALIRWILGAGALPAGRMRERLEEYGRRTGFAPSDILVWRTGNTITNALFIGILPRFRYVVVTDALLSALDPAAVEAVYAHEAGHGARRHTVVFMLMALAALLWGSIGAQEAPSAVAAAGGALGLSGDAVQGLATAAELLWIALVFLVFVFGGVGWASRRFETEADLYAVQTLENPNDFARALETIGLHLGILGRSGGLRHFGIAQRIGLIARWQSEPAFREHFSRMLRRLRITVVAVLALGAGILAMRLPEYVDRGTYQLEFHKLQESKDVSAWQGFVDRAKEKLAESPRSPERLKSYARALSGFGDVLLAKGEYSSGRQVIDELRDVSLRAEGGTRRLGMVNVEYLKVLFDAVGKVGAKPADIEDAAAEMDRLDEEMGLEPKSLAESYSDLYLAHRASGGQGFLPGTPSRYTAAAKLLRDLELRMPAKEAEVAEDEAKAAAENAKKEAEGKTGDDPKTAEDPERQSEDPERIRKAAAKKAALEVPGELRAPAAKDVDACKHRHDLLDLSLKRAFPGIEIDDLIRRSGDSQ